MVGWHDCVEDGGKPLVINSVRKIRKAETSHNFHRGSFPQHTRFSSHFRLSSTRDVPTSLMRGEGHLVDRIPWLWMSWVARVVVEGGRRNPISTVDTVDVEFKLRSRANANRSRS